MPATTFPEYVHHITDLLNHAVATGEAVLSSLEVDQRSAVRGLVAGILEFIPIYAMLCLQGKEASALGKLPFTEIQTRPLEVLDLTRLTLDEFRPLVPPFAATFQAHMAPWRFDGKPRTARRYAADQNGPLPTPADRRLLILTSLNTDPLQVVHGRLFGMGQRQANQWLHRMLVVLQAPLRALGDAPCRSSQALAPRIGVTAGEAATLVVPPAAPVPPARPPAAAPTPAAPSPLGGMRGRHGASRAPRTRVSRRAVLVARNHAIL